MSVQSLSADGPMPELGRNRDTPHRRQPPEPQGFETLHDDVLGWLLPTTLQVWIDHGADEDWGPMCYPPMQVQVGANRERR